MASVLALHFLDGVHIRSCGNGGWRFRPYGESLFFKRQKK
ncbi:hypothetical protein C4K19_0731 [Pseudomonas chlororaphis subsp. aurantiaca]|nr:hypothetical protein C4K19_0731 [Pseudomonas chlororaphis subsp. aurantiaca]AZE02854.1 hypothetical protein C4K11_0665 [Pseudomonas chlororaphis subsp. aureofaciens]